MRAEAAIVKEETGEDLKGSPTALGEENVWRLLLRFAIPSVVAMTASSLYNITDSIFIGHGVGALALSGLAVTFPLMNLAAAFGTLVGVGAANLMSLRLGQRDYIAANHILGNVVVLNLILGVAYSAVILLSLKPILYFFGASRQTIGYAYDYMFIITLGNAITHMYFGLNALLRAMGKPQKAMMNIIFSVIINVVLNPLFIYGLGWGIMGAAVATIISQAAMLASQLKFFANKKHFIHLQRGIFRLNRKIVADSLSIGLAPFLMNSAMSVIVILINQNLTRYGGDLAVGAYGIVNRVALLFLMVVMGLNQGMQPIAGYNYGARQMERVNKTLLFTILLATGVASFGFGLIQLFPRTVASAFTTDNDLIDIAAPGLQIVFLIFPLIGFQMVVSNFFQSIGKAGKAIFMSLTRQVLFLTPLLIIFPPLFGVKGVWYSIPVADMLSSIVALYFLAQHYRDSKVR